MDFPMDTAYELALQFSGLPKSYTDGVYTVIQEDDSTEGEKAHP